MTPSAPRDIFGHRPFWARRLGPAPVLPMSRAEMDALGWEVCDIVLVTGDAYMDHPSFGAALIGRLLEAQGFRVGIIAQPDWNSAEAFRALGRPALFFGITAGNMDSMVNRYTADKKIRSDDAYSPDGEGNRRPDRASLVYAQRAREAFPGVPIVLGGIEASLRRLAHYDYWSEKVRRSILLDAKADLLLYGNAERSIVEVAHRLAAGEPIDSIRDLRGTVFAGRSPGEWTEISSEAPHDVTPPRGIPRDKTVLRLPSFEAVSKNPPAYAQASRMVYLESNPFNGRALVQSHDRRDVWVNPPPLPLSTKELDRLYELPFTRLPHPSYGGAKMPAWEMIRHSVTILRGCFGGCTFCSITAHTGRIVQNRSEGSILREVEKVRDLTPSFTGVITDLGGPTANMYRLACRKRETQAVCRKLSCVFPAICPNLETNHQPLITLYRKARSVPGVKKITIGSGVRYDLAICSPEYVQELADHHVGGYLKVAPEHTEDRPLRAMMKPGIESYDRFKELFDRYSAAAGKEQYLIPYFIAAHPGTTDEDMLNLALWLKRNNFRLDQVQAFLPTPMALATAMYHTGYDPTRDLAGQTPDLPVPKGLKTRRLHKAFLRYHDPENWPLLREALERMGRSDLIGSGKRHLVPAWQPQGTGHRPEGRRGSSGKASQVRVANRPSRKRK